MVSPIASRPQQLPDANSAQAERAGSSRLQSIDALRGVVMVLMLLDHVRETFYLHRQVPDPMVVAETEPALFFSRLLAHLCAPAFVLLTGLSAYLYGNRHAADGRGQAASFLWRRGLLLVLIEVTVINFAWTFQFPPSRVFLQVIWAIGLSMLALAVLLWLPRRALIGLGLVLVAGHNLLDGVHFAPGHALHVPWAVLHDRGWIELTDSLRVRTSYPLLPWIGVIALGYAMGPWFQSSTPSAVRRQQLQWCGLGALLGFCCLRILDVYGDKPWTVGETPLSAVMGFFNLTKYPPSLLFIALTLGISLVLLAMFERRTEGSRWQTWLVVFGSAPMFFYVFHLYALKLLYVGAVSVWGTNQGTVFGVETMGTVWVITVVLSVVAYPVVRSFAAFKARRRDLVWLKYF